MSFDRIVYYICGITDVLIFNLSFMEKLDATQIEPRYRHATIFQKYEDLKPGEFFILENDHDPKPLYYQFAAEKGNEFGWEYLLQGPDWFEVKISKK